MLCNVVFRCRGKAPVTWQTTWRSRWTTLTPSLCRSRASHQQNVGRTCTSCSTSTPSSPIPLGFWRKAPQRTACQVGIGFQQPASSSYPTLIPNILSALFCSFTFCIFYCYAFLISRLPFLHLHLHPLLCKPHCCSSVLS